jgi:ORF6N domain
MKKNDGAKKKASVGPPLERVEQKILLIRGHRVLLDADLAALYGVETRALVQAVKRNIVRFPEDFMFQLSHDELDNWRSQFVTSNPSAKMGLRQPPYAFTEQGVAMLSSVLRSQRAVAVNIQIMRTFVRLRRILSTHKDLARKLDELENKYDDQFTIVFDAIRKLMEPPPVGKKRRIGFILNDTPDSR